MRLVRLVAAAGALVAVLVSAACGDGDLDGTVKRGVAYSRTQRADLYFPDGGGDDRPAVVVVHGGGFVSGDRDQLAPYASALQERGYVAAAIDYRLSLGRWFPAESLDDPGLQRAASLARDDAIAAVAWLQANAGRYRVDPERIAIFGYSAGGITAVEAATHGAGVNAAFSVAGGGIDVDQIDPDDPPLLLFHGTADRVVPIGVAERTCDAARLVDARCEVRPFEGAGHEIAGSEFGVIVDETDRFLRTLDGG
jgi:acetyl esterase/lipase